VPAFRCFKLKGLPKNLFLAIKEALQSILTLNTVAFTVLIVDDLSVLTSLEFSDTYVTTHDTCAVPTRTGVPEGGKLGRAVMLVHCGEEDGEEGVCAMVAHQSDMVARVSELHTGYCWDVHG
jgi:hypothetical protein